MSAGETPPEEIRIEVPGLSLAGLAWGPAEARPVLGLHGWLDNAASFALVAPMLENTRFVALDLPGHGGSQHRPAGAFYHYIDYLPVVFQVADALGWKHFDLLGHSMGAGIASLAAGAEPARVRRLICVEGLGAITAEAEALPGRVAQAIAEVRELGSRPERVYPDQETMTAVLQRALPTTPRDPLSLLVSRGSVAVKGGFRWRSDPRLRGTSPLRLTEAQVHAFLARVSAPVLLIRSSRVHRVFQAHRERFEEVMKARIACVAKIQCEVLPGGHHIHMETPTAVTALIHAFWAAHP